MDTTLKALLDFIRKLEDNLIDTTKQKLALEKEVEELKRKLGEDSAEKD